jgi:alkaline phosphatase
LLLLLLAACSESLAAPPEPAAGDVPKNVILLIGDGTGPQQLGLLMDWADAAGKSPTAFERLANEGSTGVLRTAPATGPLTDSAAGATALATGVSTDNGVISMDPEGKVLATCLEDARAKGKRTGLVSTAAITDATPACFAAHVGNRGEQEDIARQYVHDGLGADVMFGGGRKAFSDELIAEAKEKGWAYAGTREEFAALPATAKALGLFSPGSMPYAIDRDQEGEAKVPGLVEMSKKALEIVAQGDKGFFLMIEGGRIDHACHGNDAPAALGDLREFDDVIALALEFRAKHPETLVIVTADHETGGTTVTTGMPPNVLTAGHFLAMAKVEKSIEAMGVGGKPPRDFDPATKFGPVGAKFYPPRYWLADAAALERSAQFCVTFSTGNHSTTPVLVAAAGPGASSFVGVHRNTIVGKKLREWMRR